MDFKHIMNTTIQKKLITECIRGWFILDNINFGGKPEKYLKENSLKSYLNIKKHFLKTVYEFYNKIGYRSSFNVLPKNSNEVEKSAKIITESLKRDLEKQFKSNQKNICRIIAEGIDYNNDELLKQRTHYYGRSLMIENYFINKPLKTCLGSNLSKEEIKIYRNCLNECVNKMLKISCKYYKNF